MDEFLVRYLPHFVKLPGKLDLVLESIASPCPAETLASALGCETDVATQLLSTQLRQLSPSEIEARRHEYEEALHRLASNEDADTSN
jgi:hypothetical protein